MQKKVRGILSNTFVKGSIFITASSFVVNVSNYAFNSIIGRTLGPAGLSEITALFSYVAIFSIPLAVFSLIVIQRISASPNKMVYAKGVELYTLQYARKYWYVAVIAFAFIPLLPGLTRLSPTSSYALVPIILLTGIFGLYQSLMQGLQLFGVFALVGLVATLTKLLGSGFTLFGAGIDVVIVLFVISLAVATVASYKAVHTEFSRVDISGARSLPYRLKRIIKSKQLMVTVTSMVALTLFNNIDIVFAKRFLTPQESGLYSAWSLFAKIVFYALGPILSVSYVYFAQRTVTQTGKKMLWYSLTGLAIFGTGMFIMYSWFAELGVRTVFGAGFLSISPILGTAALFGILYSAVMYINNYFLSQKSRYAFVLPVVLPFYILGLYLVPAQLETYTQVVTGATACIAALYICMLYIHQRTV